MTQKRKKDPAAVQAGARIKQARQMAGFGTQADLNATLTTKYGWSTGRLGNYESGHSYPGPDDFVVLATETHTSECWLAFGVGPIRARERDQQAIRHQNLVHSVNALLKGPPQAYEEFLSAAESNAEAIRKYLDNPFRRIGDRQARRFERALGRGKGWMDEQHIDIDPVCNQFPDDLREIMEIYSNLEAGERRKLLGIARLLGKGES